MQLHEFLAHYTQKKYENGVKNHFIFCYTQEMPILFASRFFSRLQSDGSQIQTINIETISLDEVISQLEMSFLGTGLLYWLRGFDQVDKKIRDRLMQYLTKYQGPHRIILLVAEQDKKNLQKEEIINIPEEVDIKLFEQLFTLDKKKTSGQAVLIFKQLSQRYKKISVDDACMIVEYLKVAGCNTQTMSFFEKIIVPETSLFVISQYFFAKDSRAFFNVWHQYQLEYPLAFWSVFWSEQLWRAYFVWFYLNQKNHAAAKSMSFRLPFTYLQKDWKKSSLTELKNAHQYIYELDLNAKSSVETTYSLDLFYSKFFSNEFTVSQ
jgi:hypothetical protein